MGFQQRRNLIVTNKHLFNLKGYCKLIRNKETNTDKKDSCNDY